KAGRSNDEVTVHELLPTIREPSTNRPKDSSTERKQNEENPQQYGGSRNGGAGGGRSLRGGSRSRAGFATAGYRRR
ncbi:MAG: hypothetical protein MUF25_09310, partial [Pirellulaceae bacterium]|nr:hypothetical protein [Pirellulaceae bacterium]